jgi:hypothetical protein
MEGESKDPRAVKLAQVLIEQNCHEKQFLVDFATRQEAMAVRDAVVELGYEATVDPQNPNRLLIAC